MMRLIVALVLLAMMLAASGCAGDAAIHESGRTVFQRPVATYSIVARDPRSGEIGVAVQSHWFSVGSVVPWAQAGVGAVATQSLVDPSYGPLGLEMMRHGRAAPAALAGLLQSDEGRAVRQVAMIDVKGNVAAHTGERCIAHAGHIVDEERQFSVQANLMEHPTVWTAMAEAYRATPADADLAERLLLALEAAEAEGGDIRGRQSAAMVIVRAQSTGQTWKDRLFDLRVEDHPEPVKELRRLVQLQRAYNHMNAGDEAIEKADFEKASQEYAAAARHAPQMVEIPFWHAVALVSAGKVDEALPIFRGVFEREPIWAELVPRLANTGLLPDDWRVQYRISEQFRDLVHAYWQARLGKTVTLEVTVPQMNHKAGQVAAMDEFPFHVDIAGNGWPVEALGKPVRITGRVVARHDISVLFKNEPDPLEGHRIARTMPLRIPLGADPMRAQLRYVLEDATWERIEAARGESNR